VFTSELRGSLGIVDRNRSQPASLIGRQGAARFGDRWRFEQTPTGTRMETELEYRVELPWPQKALTPLMDFQTRRPMRKQLRSLLSVVKGRIGIPFAPPVR
jgi:hypothetical protein